MRIYCGLKTIVLRLLVEPVSFSPKFGTNFPKTARLIPVTCAICEGKRNFYGTEAYDPYKILNIEPGASLKDIRNAYISLSKRYHPDYNTGDEVAAEKFVLITNAYRNIVEKVENQQAEDEKNEDIKGEERAERTYDFNVSPLGTETEKSEDVIEWDKITWDVTKILIFFFFLMLLKSSYGADIKEYAENKWNTEKSREAQKAEMKQKLQEAIIEEHTKQKNIKQEFERIDLTFGRRW